MHLIYEHWTPSGKVYVGQTSRKNPRERWRGGNGYKYKNCNTPLYRAILKYGWNGIEHKIIATNLTKEKADELEIKLIEQYKQQGICLNVDKGGRGGPAGRTLPESQKKRISESLKGHKCPQRAIDALLNWKQTHNPPRTGIKATAEQRKRLSDVHKGIKLSDSAKEKLSRAFLGRKWMTPDGVIKKNIKPNEFENYLAMGWMFWSDREK